MYRPMLQAVRKINQVFGVQTDGSSAQDMVFIELLRSLSCNHYLAQRRIFTFTYETKLPQNELRQQGGSYLAASSNDMKMQSLLDYQVTFNCFHF